MKETMKELGRSTAISIGIAMTIFCLAGIIFDLRYGGHFSLDHYSFTKMVIGCVLIGLGFGVPSIVYNNENLPRPIQVVIHMGIGCIVYTLVAYGVGWIGGSETIGHGVLAAIIQLGISFVIWYLFMRYYRKEAEIMNKKIQSMKK
jgi:hypothetical protein